MHMLCVSKINLFNGGKGVPVSFSRPPLPLLSLNIYGFNLCNLTMGHPLHNQVPRKEFSTVPKGFHLGCECLCIQGCPGCLPA